MAACALVSGVVGCRWSLGFVVLECLLRAVPGSGVFCPDCMVVGLGEGEGPSSSESSSDSSLFPSSFFSPTAPSFCQLLPLSLFVRWRCSANSSSLISMSNSLFGMRIASPWYSFSLSILTTWVPHLLPPFQLGSGVILTMVSYLAGSAQILQGPVQ